MSKGMAYFRVSHLTIQDLTNILLFLDLKEMEL